MSNYHIPAPRIALVKDSKGRLHAMSIAPRPDLFQDPINDAIEQRVQDGIKRFLERPENNDWATNLENKWRLHQAEPVGELKHAFALMDFQKELYAAMRADTWLVDNQKEMLFTRALNQLSEKLWPSRDLDDQE